MSCDAHLILSMIFVCKSNWTRTRSNSVLRLNVDLMEKLDLVLLQFSLQPGSWKKLSSQTEALHDHSQDSFAAWSSFRAILILIFSLGWPAVTHLPASALLLGTVHPFSIYSGSSLSFFSEISLALAFSPKFK